MVRSRVGSDFPGTAGGEIKGGSGSRRSVNRRVLGT